MNRLISIGELAELKGISVDTIRRWEKEGKLESVRTDGGHRRYRLSDFVEEKTGKTIAYARVSSYKTTLRGRINGYPNLLQRLAHAST
jgi:putative resolvase